MREVTSIVGDDRELTGRGMQSPRGSERSEKRTSDECSTAGVDFADFVAARLPALLRFGRLLTGNAASAEDLVQTALMKSYGKWDRIESSDPERYVRRAMANTQASWWRRPVRERPYEQLPERPDTDADPYVTVELRDAVWGALDSLSSRQRAALVLRFYEELSMVEIAEMIGCRTGTAKSLVSRGLATLRQSAGLVETDEDEEGTATNKAEQGAADR